LGRRSPTYAGTEAIHVAWRKEEEILYQTRHRHTTDMESEMYDDSMVWYSSVWGVLWMDG
jgi:hypothetical protein